MPTPNALSQQPTVPRPDLVLRIGFAGNRRLPADTASFDAVLDTILQTVTARLAANLVPEGERAASTKIARFYSDAPPLLRLVTGLAEGGDERAAMALDRLDAPALGVRTELAAILPFGADAYRASRDEAFRAEFDRRRAACAYIYELDGIHSRQDPPEPRIHRRRRARAYRAQSKLLLRHIDFLVAAADFTAEAKPGGTVETVRKALAFDLPVIVIDLGDQAAVRLVEPEQDLSEALEESPDDPAVWPGRLGEWVQSVVADPDAPTDVSPTASVEGEARDAVIEEYFLRADFPPKDSGGTQRKTFREGLWNRFERFFRRLPPPKSDERLQPFAAYRDRATALNYHYSGLYRGAFVLNYGLAVVAVLIAALSLVLAGRFAVHPAEGEDLWLGGLALLKLGLLAWIFFNTLGDHRGNWSKRAVDYRYLAERLRTMYYLPRLGSFQSPAPVTPKLASRNVRQSAVDWLFEAIVRSVDPSTVAAAGEEGKKARRIDAAGTLKLITEKWIGAQRDLANLEAGPGSGQIFYHQRNHDTLDRMYERLDRWVQWLNISVILVVVVDLAAVIFEWNPEHSWSVWLLFGATVLPAAVAGLNGLRFQSECQRLAERSGIMFDLLRDRLVQAESLQAAMADVAGTEDDRGSHGIEVLALAEHVARELVEEVAEWSVIYAKDVTDT